MALVNALAKQGCTGYAGFGCKESTTRARLSPGERLLGVHPLTLAAVWATSVGVVMTASVRGDFKFPAGRVEVEVVDGHVADDASGSD